MLILLNKALLLNTTLCALIVFSVSLSAAGTLTDSQKHQLALDMYADYRKSFPEVQDIDAQAAMGLLSEPDVVFVDVRKAKEQAVSMIPGAIKKETFMDQIEQYRNKRIIVYCTISYRSGKLASKLRRKGISVTNLEAGLLGWVHAGGPLVRQDKVVQSLHVYGRKWDLAPAAIDTVY
jgi:sodium/bile acid cotransporter 7